MSKKHEVYDGKKKMALTDSEKIANKARGARTVNVTLKNYRLQFKSPSDTITHPLGSDPPFATKKSPTFYTLAVQWLEMRAPQLKESTLIKYANLLEHYIFPALGALPASQVSRGRVEQLCCNLLQCGNHDAKGLSPKTVSDVLSVTRNIVKYYKSRGFFDSLDLSQIEIKQVPKELRVLSNREQQTLCRYLYQHLDFKALGVLLSLFTGLRIGELCALQWEDISLVEKTLSVSKTMQRIQIKDPGDQKTKIVVSSPKSICSVRTIPLTDELIKIITPLAQAASGYFLTGNAAQFVEPRSMQNYFKHVLKECGLENINFHALRHTFATRCVEIGFDVKSLSEILGHANINITLNRYVHPSIELKRRNMQKLSQLWLK